MKRPNLFLIGAAKCGTTSLYYYLKQHPDIFFPDHKEPHYFSTDLQWRYRGTEFANLSEYLALFQDATTQRWIGEASVWHLFSQDAAANIFEFDPAAKLICILRNPIDMMHSLYRFGFARGSENATSFQQALELEPGRTDWDSVPRTLFLLNAVWYRQVCRFDQQVTRYLDRFPRENIKFLLFDDLKRDAHQVVRETFEFLDVDADVPIDLTNQNITSGLARDRLQYLTRFAPNLAHNAGRLVPAWAKRGLRRVLGRRRNEIPADGQKMPDELRHALLEEYRPSIEATGELIGRDLTSWLQV